MAMFLLNDDHGMPLGVFGSPKEAMTLVREVDQWKLAGEGAWRGGGRTTRFTTTSHTSPSVSSGSSLKTPRM